MCLNYGYFNIVANVPQLNAGEIYRLLSKSNINKMNRIQRKRIKGYKTLPNTKFVGRSPKWGNPWGNPFKLVGDIIYIHAGHRRKHIDPWIVFEYNGSQRVLKLYRSLFDRVTSMELIADSDYVYWHNHFQSLDLNDLRKYDGLSCFCPDGHKCHVDVLIELLQCPTKKNQ